MVDNKIRIKVVICRWQTIDKEKVVIHPFYLIEIVSEIMSCNRLIAYVRATTSVRANFLSILQGKTYFFYFIYSLLQNTHISLFIPHIYSIKYSFFLHFLLFASLSSLELSQKHNTNPKSPTPNHQPPSTIKQNKPIGITSVHYFVVHYSVTGVHYRCQKLVHKSVERESCEPKRVERREKQILK